MSDHVPGMMHRDQHGYILEDYHGCGCQPHERSAGAVPLDVDAIEWLDILWRHLDERDKDAIRPGYQKIIERLSEGTDR